jgi:hypothetical protein
MVSSSFDGFDVGMALASFFCHGRFFGQNCGCVSEWRSRTTRMGGGGVRLEVKISRWEK